MFLLSVTCELGKIPILSYCKRTSEVIGGTTMIKVVKDNGQIITLTEQQYSKCKNRLPCSCSICCEVHSTHYIRMRKVEHKRRIGKRHIKRATLHLLFIAVLIALSLVFSLIGMYVVFTSVVGTISAVYVAIAAIAGK